MSHDLKFDNMVETGEGKKYMELHIHEFNSFGFENSDKYECDIQNNKIIYAKGLEHNIPAKELVTEKYLQCLPEKLTALANILEAKKLVFAQIDYLLRGTPIEETLNFDLKLMVQNIRYFSMLHTRKFCETNVILMHGKSPLSSLGFVAQLLCAYQTVAILSTKETAVLCHLFVSLCHEVGLTNVKLAFEENLLNRGVDVASIMKQGCVGIVTDRADVDSAADVFLASVTRDPWKIRRILVQESVCERLREVFSWKAKLSPSNSDLGDVMTKCSNVYEIKGKKFVYEYCGDEELDHYIIIEAYRTVKELLSLIGTYKPFSVSLWCSDVSQSNEIAYKIDSSIIWINDYGCFRGPLKSSQAFYSKIDNRYGKLSIRPLSDINVLTNVRDEWVKLDENKKHEIFNLSLKKFESSEQLNSSELGLCIDESFAKVVDSCICVGTEVTYAFVLFHDPSYRLADVLRCLLKGSAVFYMREDPRAELYDALRGEGAPLEPVVYDLKYLVVSSHSECITKVVRTSFGTIFAN